jgi:hypothetical protein
MRESKTGSVMTMTPKKFIKTVAWPSQLALKRSLGHSSGFGFANAGAIGRQLSTVHSCQRWLSQLRFDFAAGMKWPTSVSPSADQETPP